MTETESPLKLDAEWQRIKVLGQCLFESRSGREPTKVLLQQLRKLQREVDLLRRENNGWQHALTADLSELALDSLACVYAPLINPAAALLFQDLQQTGSSQPTLAFLHRLLALDDKEYFTLQQLVDEQGLLLKRGLLTAEGVGPMRCLQGHSNVLAMLNGLPPKKLHIPGALLIEIKAGWEDLIIAPAQRRMLHEYLLWIKYADTIVKDWGARPAGGPIALFSGPSGTGKTFAASVVANELGWSLYRVDLGALISKYIGETEKNLNALFAAVQGKKIILQFDEVDALMGKRGEIKDARDRYANLEVSHLLSRIEQHQGPCILTTNLRKQIDPAFQRRFHFVILFPHPDVKDRIALWKSLLPPYAPLAEELDYPLMAQAATLSGGEIRNAANHAAVLAAAEAEPIQLKHIAVGVWRVLQKTDGQTRTNQLQQLAEHLPEEIICGAVP